jgi:hypothetical protein
LAILLLGSLAGFLALGMLVPSGEEVPPITERLACFNDLPQRSRSLITAIRQFEVDHGAPPTDLGELVPRYLPAIPDTGVARFPAYEYKVLSKDEQVPVMWYDLGPAPDLAPIERHHRDFGPADHVILLLTIRKDPRHNLLTADGLPRNLGAEPFHAANWRSDRPSRIRMAESLVARYGDEITTRADALSLLGEPDGEGMMHDTPWELSVPCIWDKWHPDRIIYRPTQKYWSAPGWVFPVGDWLYIRGD